MSLSSIGIQAMLGGVFYQIIESANFRLKLAFGASKPDADKSSTGLEKKGSSKTFIWGNSFCFDI